MNKYAIKYEYEGLYWLMYIFADSFDDAKKRMFSISPWSINSNKAQVIGRCESIG